VKNSDQYIEDWTAFGTLDELTVCHTLNVIVDSRLRARKHVPIRKPDIQSASSRTVLVTHVCRLWMLELIEGLDNPRTRQALC